MLATRGNPLPAVLTIRIKQALPAHIAFTIPAVPFLFVIEIIAIRAFYIQFFDLRFA